MATNDIKIIQEVDGGELIERNVAVTPGQVLGFDESGQPVSRAESDPAFAAWFASVKAAVPADLDAAPISSSRIDLSWSAADRATGYKVYRDGVLIASLTGTTYSNTGLTAETAYSYTVSATNAYGESAQCEPVLATTLAAGAGYALQFDGVQNWAEAPNSASLYSTVFTLELWVKGGTKFDISNQNGYGFSDGGMGLYADNRSGGYLSVLYGHTGDWYTYLELNGSVPVDLFDGAWHHVAGTHTGTQFSLWIDGVEVGTGASAGLPMKVGAAKFFIGGASDQNINQCDGILDEVRVSSVVRYTDTFTPERTLGSDANTLAYWPLDEGSGTTAADASGNGHDATLTGSPLPVWVSMADDKALQFDGSQNYAETAASDAFQGSTITIEARIRILSSSNDNTMIVTALNNWDASDGWFLNWSRVGGYIQFQGRIGSIILITAPDVNDGAWHHIAVVGQSGSVAVYIDGLVRGTGTLPISTGGAASESTLVVGASRFSGGGITNTFVGAIDEVRISSIVRYTDTFVPADSFTPDSDTVAYWKMDSGGDTVPDESGNGHTLTLQGSPKPYYTDGVTV